MPYFKQHKYTEERIFGLLANQVRKIRLHSYTDAIIVQAYSDVMQAYREFTTSLILVPPVQFSVLIFRRVMFIVHAKRITFDCATNIVFPGRVLGFQDISPS